MAAIYVGSSTGMKYLCHVGYPNTLQQGNRIHDQRVVGIQTGPRARTPNFPASSWSGSYMHLYTEGARTPNFLASSCSGEGNMRLVGGRAPTAVFYFFVLVFTLIKLIIYANSLAQTLHTQ